MPTTWAWRDVSCTTCGCSDNACIPATPSADSGGSVTIDMSDACLLAFMSEMSRHPHARDDGLTRRPGSLDESTYHTSQQNMCPVPYSGSCYSILTRTWRILIVPLQLRLPNPPLKELLYAFWTCRPSHPMDVSENESRRPTCRGRRMSHEYEVKLESQCIDDDVLPRTHA